MGSAKRAAIRAMPSGRSRKRKDDKPASGTTEWNEVRFEFQGQKSLGRWINGSR